MAVLYSGRFDILVGDELLAHPIFREHIPPGNVSVTYGEYFRQFLHYAGSDYYILTFEKFEKDGITPCKFHCHFLFNSIKKHDTLRAKLSDMGWKGALASLSAAESPPKRTIEKSHHYVLKQGNVVYSSLSSDELNKLMGKAKEYNDELVLKPQFEYHFKNIMIPDMVSKGIVYRGDIVAYIIRYATQYNLNDRGYILHLPISTMVQWLQYYEMITSPETAVASIINDYRHIDGIWKTAKGAEIQKMNEEIAEKRVRLLEKVNKLTPIVNLDDFSDLEI